MSRTFRKKNFSPDEWSFGDFRTEADFEYGRMVAQRNFSHLEEASALARQLDFGSESRLECYRRIRNDPQYNDWRIALRWRNSVHTPNETYKEWRKRKANQFHADGTWSWCAPGWYCNILYERPMRRKVKSLIRKNLVEDGWDYQVWPECTNGAGYTYW